MTFFESILLGIVQGVTEFLPISSSGHLVIFQKLLGFSSPPVFFDILLHLATLCAVVVYFRKSLVRYLTTANLKKIIIASIPAGILGVFLSSHIDTLFSSLMVVGIGLIVTGSLMLYTRKIPSSNSDEITDKKAFFIGLFQATALIPGISRSGSTIFGSLINNVSKAKAFEFSFIISIPAIIGALLLQIIFTPTSSLPVENMAGFMAAFLAGLLAIKMLDFVINHQKLHYFGYYCLIVGVGSLIVAL